MENLKTMVTKANEQIKKVTDWLAKNENAFNYMDLKLHDVSYYCCSQMKDDFPLCYEEDKDNCSEYNFFYTFCESSYIFMLEDFELRGIDYKTYQLGRTSSFYLHDQNIVSLDGHRNRYNSINYGATIQNAINELFVSCGNIYYSENGMIDEEKTEFYFENEEKFSYYYKDELNYIINDLYNDFIKEFENVIEIYDYIKSFKENQIENFKGWIEQYEEDKQVELDEAKEYEEKRQKLLAKFKEPAKGIYERCISSCDDLETLILKGGNKI